MIPYRLLTYGATLACAVTALVSPAPHTSAQPTTPSVTYSAALPASSVTIKPTASTASFARHDAFTNRSLTHTRRSTSSTSDSRLTTFEALVLIVIITIVFLPACIIYVIFYRRARKDVHDMPNYTGTNGPQYGVTGYPQGTVPPSQSRYTGFNPLWSRNTSYSGGPVTPGTPGANGYGTAPAQVPTYGTPTGQGPVYGTQPTQGPTYRYGTHPGQASPYGYGGQTPAGGYGIQAGEGAAYGIDGGQGYGTAPATQAQHPPFGQAPGQPGSSPNY